jgi:AcrR family transcriptional regulator
MADIRAKKTDRRVVRTRNAIREAFTDLLMETDYNKITITALAKRADVDRKTFYTHYSSIEALLEDVVRTQMEESMHDLGFPEFAIDHNMYTRRLLAAVEASLPFTREQLRTVTNNIPTNEFLRIWTNVMKERIESQTTPLSKDDDERLELLIEFYLGGVLNAYLCWLHGGSNLPFEDMLNLVSNSVSKGLTGTISTHVRF